MKRRIQNDDSADDAKEFNAHLQEAEATDLSELERTGCVSEGRDNNNFHIITMIPSLGLRPSEKPDVTFRKMLLLFIRRANAIVGSPYAIVYAHTSIDIINQYPLIYKFYSILPHSYKKNLQRMYIIHPNTGIKMFFEFARVFLSHKFYNKLCLLDSILEFQKIISPKQLNFPLKFYRREDDDNGYKYFGTMASLGISFVNSVGTTKLIETCVEFIRAQDGCTHQGIFRVPGDEIELNLAKIRLQNAKKSDNSRITLSENKDYVLIGDLETLLKPLRESKLEGQDSSPNPNPNPNPPGKARLSDKSEITSREDTPMSIIRISNLDTVCQVLKMSIRDLPDPLISSAIFKQIDDAIEQKGGMNDLWSRAVAAILASLDYENLSTLKYLISFLKEVSDLSAVNQMDASNLGIVFSPTVFRSDQSDIMKVLAEAKTAQLIIKELIERPQILHWAVALFKERNSSERGLSEVIRSNPVMETPADCKVDASLTDQLSSLHLNLSAASNSSPPLSHSSSSSGGGGPGKLTNAMMGRIQKGTRGENSRSFNPEDGDESSWNLKSQSVDSGERLFHRGRHKQYLKGIPLEEDDSGDDGTTTTTTTTVGINIAIPAKEKRDHLSPLRLGMYHEEDGSKEEDNDEDDGGGGGGVWRSVTTPPSRHSANDTTLETFQSLQESHLNNNNNHSNSNSSSGKINAINRVKSASRVERSSRL